MRASSPMSTTAAASRLRPVLARTVVALDFDGTLAPIVERPEDARPLPAAAETLTAVAAEVAAVAIITGRPAADVVRLGGFEDVPGLVVFGHYGLERWADGLLETPDEAAGVDLARGRAAELAAARPGVSLEDKGHSVALHTRRAPDPSATFDELVPLAAEIARDAGLEVTPGRFVLELRPAGADKGAALAVLMRDWSAAGVVYAGDDLGDIPAVRELRAADGVVGVVICSDSDEPVPALRDLADLVVPGPRGVLDALRALVLGGETA